MTTVSEDIIARTLIGESLSIRQLRRLIAKAAPTRLPVLIEGPTGAGKELVAQAIHEVSQRHGELVAFNVCAVPETVFEDALFGHVKGAFTGATSDAAGYLTEAHAGTAFFDEIGGLSAAMQAKLLRAIETRRFRPVGGRSDRTSDFRVVAATNEPLESLVEANRFRADLYQRLHGIVLRVPPLNERREDIPILARHFAERTALELGRDVSIESCALRKLQAHSWPGNVRELRRVIESGIVMADEPVLRADAFTITSGESRESRRSAMAEREGWLDLLEECGGDTGALARRLGVGRATVYRRLQHFAIPTPKRVQLKRAGATTKSPEIAVAI